MRIYPLKKEDIKEVAQIANECFKGYGSLAGAVKWITCNFAAYPRMQYFAAKESAQGGSALGGRGKVIGYILWMEKGGFRKEAVWEIEQIGVSLNCQGRGVATKLVLESLAIIKKNLKKRGSALKLVEATTGLHQAPYLYQKTLGAKKEAIIKDFFRGDEMILIARFKS